MECRSFLLTTDSLENFVWASRCIRYVRICEHVCIWKPLLRNGPCIFAYLAVVSEQRVCVQLYICSTVFKCKFIPCEGGVEYLNRDPASRRRRRKGKSRIWDSKIWSRVPQDSDQRITALERASSNCKRWTRPLVKESAPHQQTCNCLTVIKIWSWAPDGCFIPRQTGRLTVGRNRRLRLKCNFISPVSLCFRANSLHVSATRGYRQV
jgi:hypothetical protein